METGGDGRQRTFIWEMSVPKGNAMSFLSLAKNYGRAAKAAVCRVFNLTTWAPRRFPRFFSRLYIILKLLVGGVLGTIMLDLLVAEFVAEFDLHINRKAMVFIGAHLILILLATDVVFILFLMALVGRRVARLQAAFDICTHAEELSLEDLGFQLSCPLKPESQDPSSYKPRFFGKYFLRQAKSLEATTSPGEDEDEEVKYTEEYFQQCLREGGRFLLVDAPGAGKTMTLFQVLRGMRGYTIVLQRHLVHYATA